MALSQDRIVAILRQELVQAQGADHDELSSNRKAALDYFFNATRGDEVPGKSKVQSSDVSDMVEAVLSNIAPILTRETLIQFEAAGEQDETQAQLESDFVAYMVAGQNAGYVELISAIKDSLLLKNGFIKVWIEKTDTDRTFTDKGLSDFQIQAKLDEADAEMHLEILKMEDGENPGTHDVTWKEFTHKRELRVSAVAPEDLLYSPDHDSPYLRSCRFVAERKLLTRSELLIMGYPKSKVDELPGVDTDLNSQKTARKRTQSEDDTAVDPANKLIETFDIHTLIDKDETGISELRHFHLAHNTILLDEGAEWVPLATGSPFIIPHRLYGQSLYDKLRTVQDSKTDFLRQWHDNARIGNNFRAAYNPMTTEEADVLDSSAMIRSRDPAGVQQFVTSDLGDSIRAALDYQDKTRSEKAGASLDLISPEFQLAAKNVGDQGVERQLSVKEQLAAMMTASLANTLIRETFLLVHMTLRAQMPGDLSAKLNGKWVRTNPTSWPERKKVNVMTGLSRGEKSQRLVALNQVVQLQLSFLQQGLEGVIVDRKGVFNSISDWSRTAGLENVEQYWVDPESEEGQQAAQAKDSQAQAAQQAQQQAIQQQSQQQNQIFALQAQLDKYKHDTQLLFDYAKERLDAEIEEAKLVGTATLDLERQQLVFDNAQQGAVNGAASQ